jgi:hypothetical protein
MGSFSVATCSYLLVLGKVGFVQIIPNNNDGKHIEKVEVELPELTGAFIPLVLYQMFHPGHFQGLLYFIFIKGISIVRNL